MILTINQNYNTGSQLQISGLFFYDFSDIELCMYFRISLKNLNTFGDEVFGDPKVLQSYYYGITHFIVGGRCKCNGHSNVCIPKVEMLEMFT